MASVIELIVGLGNPGPKYEHTRHNVGYWLVDEVARQAGKSFRLESKFHGEICQLSLHGQSVRLLKPTTFMNLSGQSVLAIAQFYKLKPENILVIHDELDIPPGAIRLKQGGGHGGHNGLRDISSRLSKEFVRLRLGIGHPGHAREVSNYVLGKPSSDDKIDIQNALDASLNELALIVTGELQKAMNHLHSR